MENTNTLTNIVNGHSIDLEGDLAAGITAAQRARIEWLDANLYHGISAVYIFGASPRVDVPAGTVYATTGGHPEGREVIAINRVGGMEVSGSALDLLGDLINNAPPLNPSVLAARKIDVPATAIKAVADALAMARTNPVEARARLAELRDELGETVYQLAKFRAIANAA